MVLNPSAPQIITDSYDIGDGVGNVRWSGTTLTFRAMGNQLADQATDNFCYLTFPLEGDGMLTARVISMVNTNAWAKVAVQIRETLSETSRNAMMEWQPDKRIFFQFSEKQGNRTKWDKYQKSNYELPLWLRIVRRGDLITGLVSKDGRSFEQVGQESLSYFPQRVYMGIALTSNACKPTTAVLDNCTYVVGGTPDPFASALS